MLSNKLLTIETDCGSYVDNQASLNQPSFTWFKLIAIGQASNDHLPPSQYTLSQNQTSRKKPPVIRSLALCSFGLVIADRNRISDKLFSDSGRRLEFYNPHFIETAIKRVNFEMYSLHGHVFMPSQCTQYATLQSVFKKLKPLSVKGFRLFCGEGGISIIACWLMFNDFKEWSEE